MWPFVPESLRRHIEGQQQRHFEEVLVPGAVAWEEDATKFAPELCLAGETYRPPFLFDAAPVRGGTLAAAESVVDPSGRFLYCNRVLPRGTPLHIYQGRRRGQVWFTADVVIPVLAEVTAPGAAPRTWMSLTPNEVFSMRAGVRLATGKVVVGGLGLGWLLQKVCAKPSVKEVILVERAGALVDWLLPAAKQVWPHVAGKLKKVIVGDALEEVGRHGGAAYLVDIWDDYGDAVYDRAFQRLAKKVPRVWGWGDVALPRGRHRRMSS